MKFRNRSAAALKFEIDKVSYKVEVGGTVDIPDRIAYHVTTAGLPLDAVEETSHNMKGSRGEATEGARRGAGGAGQPQGGAESHEHGKHPAPGLTSHHFGTDEEQRAAATQPADAKSDDKDHAGAAKKK